MGRPPPGGSTEFLTLTGHGGRLDRVQHAMARHSVFKGGAEMRSLAIVTGETRVRLATLVAVPGPCGGAHRYRSGPGRISSEECAPRPPRTSISKIWACPPPAV